MYSVTNYINRGLTFINNRLFPGKRKLSTLAIFGTDLCDSACKHCLIWTKRPVNYLSFDKIKEIMKSKCIGRDTTIALAGGEFLLHPDSLEIMKWFKKHHPNFDVLTNGLKPDSLVEAIEKAPPRRLFISLDGDKETYLHMRGKDGYDGIINAIEQIHDKVPISIMFTLSPYNNFDDLSHVMKVCKKYHLDLRIGVYNDISFFDTVEDAHVNDIGSLRNKETRSFSEAKKLIGLSSSKKALDTLTPVTAEKKLLSIKENLPELTKEFAENYDYLLLYDEWRRGNVKLTCNSILDSIVILPNGDVPICQNLNVLTGNIFTNTLDEIVYSTETQKLQKHYSKNCNACWINFHRKYDIILYRNFERFFGKWATSKILGYYWWDSEKKKPYKKVVRP